MARGYSNDPRRIVRLKKVKHGQGPRVPPKSGQGSFIPPKPPLPPRPPRKGAVPAPEQGS